MPAAEKLPRISAEEYLAIEERSQIRHEYVDGVMFAMTGSTHRHNVIAGNIFAILHAHTKGSGCRTYISDMKVRIEVNNSFYYPDVMVSCGHHDESSVVAAKPVLIVEVLSPSTAGIDRREKMFAYRQMLSLREYMIVHQRRPRIELHRKTDEGGWEILNIGQGADLTLNAMPAGPLVMALDSIYDEVQWMQGQDPEVREEERVAWGDEELDW